MMRKRVSRMHGSWVANIGKAIASIPIVAVACLLWTPGNAEAQARDEDEVSSQYKSVSAARKRSGSRLRGRGLRRGISFAGPTLSREQLKQCVSTELEIDRTSGAAEEESIQLDVAASRLEQLASRLAQSEVSVNEYSEASVSAHNHLIDQYNEELEAYNARIPTAQARMEAVNRRIDSFNAACADKAYYLDDMTVVERSWAWGGNRVHTLDTQQVSG